MRPSFDPYDEWLQIPPRSRPPSAYDLLGLVAGETDTDRIEAAFHTRYAAVRKYHLGPYSETAQQVLDELSRALNTVKAAAEKPSQSSSASFPTTSEPDESQESGVAAVDTTVRGNADVAIYETLEPWPVAGDTKVPDNAEHETLQPWSIASSGQRVNSHHDEPEVLVESPSKPVDDEPVSGDFDMPSQLIAGLAVGSGIMTLLGVWLPIVSLYFTGLALGFGFWHILNVFSSPSLRDCRHHAVAWMRAKRQLWSIKNDWQAKVATHRKQIKQLHTNIESLRGERSAIARHKQDQLADVKRRAHETQLRSFLCNHAIRDELHAILHVGEVRWSTLASHGINTAYEVQYDRITSIIRSSTATSFPTFRLITHSLFLVLENR